MAVSSRMLIGFKMTTYVEEFPWEHENMFDSLYGYGEDYLGTAVTQLGQVPALVKAMVAYGKFRTAELINDWYSDMMGKVNGEYKATPTHGAEGNEGYCYCGEYRCAEVIWYGR